jgi:hypothetical protein
MRRNSCVTGTAFMLPAAMTANFLLPGAALAEFQIQEAGIEKGQSEFEYRGAYHWGVPEMTPDNPNANDLIQSHELELQYGLTNWWLMGFTVGLEQPLHEDFNASDVEFETEFALIKREGDGIALSFQGGYQKSVIGQADVVGFGPIVELAHKNLLITLNPLFTDQVGPNRDNEGLGFEYGWRAEYDFAKHWGIGVEMFGEIEDLTHAGTFNQQNHSLGPTLFWSPAKKGEDVGDAAGGGVDEKNGAGPAPLDLSFNIGVQFGLTDATSDAALKFQGSLSF